MRLLFLQYHYLQEHFRDFKTILVSFKIRMFKLFISSLYCWHNFVIKPRFWVSLHSGPFYWGYEIFCSNKSMYKIRLSIIYTNTGQILWENNFAIEFSNIFWWKTFSLGEQKFHSAYGIVGMSFLISKSGRGQTGEDLWRLIDWFCYWVWKCIINNCSSLISDLGWPYYYLF